MIVGSEQGWGLPQRLVDYGMCAGGIEERRRGGSRFLSIRWLREKGWEGGKKRGVVGTCITLRNQSPV